MATNYERGRQYEYKSARILEGAGYNVIRSAGSKGVFDLVGSCNHGTAYVQVKFGCRPTAAEMEALQMANVPTNSIRLIHIWTKGQSWPLVIIV